MAERTKHIVVADEIYDVLQTLKQLSGHSMSDIIGEAVSRYQQELANEYRAELQAKMQTLQKLSGGNGDPGHIEIVPLLDEA